MDARRLKGAIVLEFAVVDASEEQSWPYVTCTSLLPGGADQLSQWCVSSGDDAASMAMARLHACSEAFYHAAHLGVAPMAFPARAAAWVPQRPSPEPRLRVMLQLAEIKAYAYAIHCWTGIIHYVNNPRDYHPWHGQHVVEDLRPHVHDWAMIAMGYWAAEGDR